MYIYTLSVTRKKFQRRVGRRMLHRVDLAVALETKLPDASGVNSAAGSRFAFVGRVVST
jgi:hypothetical protein